jgi:integrase
MEEIIMANFYKNKDGWAWRIRRRDKNGGWENLGDSGFRLKKEAVAAAAKVEERLESGLTLKNKDITFPDYFDNWIHLYKLDKGLSAASEEWYTNTLKWIRVYFSDKKLSELKRDDYQQFITWLGTEHEYTAKDGKTKTKRALAKITVQKMNSYIRAMARDAQDDQIILIDFTRRIVLVGQASKSADEKFLSEADFNKLIKETYRRANIRAIADYMILTQAYTGMRFEEVLGVSWDRINFENKTLKIDRSWDYKSRPRKQQNGFGPLKNKPSYRTIAIPDELCRILKKLHTEQSEAFLRSGYRDPDNLVFRNYRGEWVGNDGINQTLERITTAIKIPHITSHGLRHTHGSVLLYHGVNIMSISRRLGHGDLQTTLNIYMHVVDEMKAREDGLITSVLENLAI